VGDDLTAPTQRSSGSAEHRSNTEPRFGILGPLHAVDVDGRRVDLGGPGSEPESTDTLRGWCKQADVDAGRRPGTTTGDAARIKELERDNRELKRANEILLAASSFFARELDPRLPW
jgi:transposase